MADDAASKRRIWDKDFMDSCSLPSSSLCHFHTPTSTDWLTYRQERLSSFMWHRHTRVADEDDRLSLQDSQAAAAADTELVGRAPLDERQKERDERHPRHLTGMSP